ncbi:MAG: type II toxin-antitoxin system Phd/YefM family antitoxin [Solirubrobacteraceae bacterium]
MDRTVTASRFKAQCLALLDDVANNGSTLVLTKRGRPVARVVPIEPPRSLRGSVRYLVSDDELVEPLAETWDAESVARR